MEPVELNITKIVLENEPHQIIEKTINALRYAMSACDDVIGQGMFGTVSFPNYSRVAKVILSEEKEVILRTVIKKLKGSTNQQFNIYNLSRQMIDEHISTLPSHFATYLKHLRLPNKLDIIYSNNHDPHCEYILLSFTSKLWYDGVTPHVPFLITPMACDGSDRLNAFLLEANGLPNKLPLKHNMIPLFLGTRSPSSYCETFYKLMLYIMSTIDKKTMKCELPNKKTVDVPSLIDTFIISYLFTYQQLLNKYGIVLLDQHADNVFIYWLDQYSHVGLTFIGDLENIIYELDDNTELSIETNGLLLKIGDIGASIMKPRDDLVIIGEMFDSPNLVDRVAYVDKLPCYMQFLTNMSFAVPQYISEKTKLSKIFETSPFNEFSEATGIDFMYPTALDVLKTFFKPHTPKNSRKNIEKSIRIKLI